MNKKKICRVYKECIITFKVCGVILKVGKGTKDKNPEEVDVLNHLCEYVYVWYDNYWYSTHVTENKPYDSIFEVHDYLTSEVYCKAQLIEKLLNII